MIFGLKQITNGGSKLLNVNGSVTPQTFSYSNNSGAYQELTSLICILRDEGNTSFGNFGSKSALTNGVLIQVTQNNSTRTLSTMKDNADVCMTFPENQFGNGAILSILSIVTPEGFGDTNNCMVGILSLDKSIPLNNGDSVSVVIQDNLSGVGTFQISCGIVMD